MHRSLHIIDIENLAGTEHANIEAIAVTSTNYRSSTRIGPMDQIVVGTNMDPTYRLTVGLEWPGAQVVSGHGPNGSDHALLTAVDPTWVVDRGFERVVIGSGDRCFASLGTTLKRAGVVVQVIARAHETHCSLWPASHRVVALPIAAAIALPAELVACEHLVAAA